MPRKRCALRWTGTGCVAAACALIGPSIDAQVVSTGQSLPGLVSGSGVAVQGWVVIGDDAPGAVSVSSGGSFRSAGVTLGRQTTGHGQLEVRGTSAIADSLDDLVIGDAGVGELRVLQHARLTTGPASDLWLGRQSGGTGRLIVDGYATADLGGHGYVSARHPESPGRPSVSLDQGATLRFGLGNPGGVAAGTVGSFALGYAGPETVTLSAAGDGTLLDVPGVWSLGHAGPAEAELFDNAFARVGTLHLGVASAATILLDGATLSANTLHAGTAPHAPATLTADAHSALQLGQGGLRFGPILGLSPIGQAPAAARFTLRGSLTSQGPIDLGGTTEGPGLGGHRVALLDSSASLSTIGELRIGGPRPDDRATLSLQDANASANSASVEPGGTLSGHGTLTLGRQLTVVGTVEAPGGVLTVDAARLSRFFADATLAVGYAVIPIDHDADPHTPSLPTITHGTLRFTDDARLDGTLDLRRNENFPALPIEAMPWYEPFTLADTAEAFTGWFDRIAGVRLTEDSALAVVQTDSALIAQRALLGDANLDQRIDQHDLDAVLNHWGDSTAQRALDWSDGDFNGDGTIEQADLDVVLNRWGGHASPVLNLTAIPEPATACTFVLLIAAAPRPARASRIRSPRSLNAGFFTPCAHR